MSACDDLRMLLVFGRTLDASGRAHLAACPQCRLDEPVARALGRALAAEAAVEPPPGLSARVLRAAVVPLALHARRAVPPDWRAVARAVGAALVPLPLILYLDVHLVRGAYRLLTTVLPGTISFYLVFNYAAVVALLLAASYAAAPLLAARQEQGRLEERHA